MTDGHIVCKKANTVILSAAKNLSSTTNSGEILRCAQNDSVSALCPNGMIGGIV